MPYPMSGGTAPEVQALLRKAAAAPEYTALVDYLTARRMLPPMRVEGPTGEAAFTRNSFFGTALPRTGEITVGRRATPATAVHELTHAADHQLTAQYHELKEKGIRGKLSPQEQQFMAAYEKLVETPLSFSTKGALPRIDMAQRLAPGWQQKNADYRATNRELPAWGMGGTVTPNTDYPAPPHVDPTMATEFSVLMDLARRAQPVIPGR